MFALRYRDALEKILRALETFPCATNCALENFCADISRCATSAVAGDSPAYTVISILDETFHFFQLITKISIYVF